MSPEAAQLAFLAALEAEKRRRAEEQARQEELRLPIPTPPRTKTT